jgi:hypothetical protein
MLSNIANTVLFLPSNAKSDCIQFLLNPSPVLPISRIAFHQSPAPPSRWKKLQPLGGLALPCTLRHALFNLQRVLQARIVYGMSSEAEGTAP